MASNSGSRKKTTSSRTRSSSNTKAKSRSSAKNTSARKGRTQEEKAITGEILLIGVFALTILLFLCNFGLIGMVGDKISYVMFGIFGLMAYVVPVLCFIAVAFGISNQGNTIAVMKLSAGCILFFLAGIVLELITGSVSDMESYSISELFLYCAEYKTGGGVLSGSLAYLMHHFLGMVGTVLLIMVFAVICLVVITEKSLVSGVRSGSRKVYESARTDAQYRRERIEKRREEAKIRQQEREEEALLKRQERERLREERERLRQEREAKEEAERILRMDRKVSGVTMDTALMEPVLEKEKNDIHEITVNGMEEETVEIHKVQPVNEPFLDFDKIRINREEPEDGEEKEKPVFETYEGVQKQDASADVFADMKEILPSVQKQQEDPLPFEEDIKEPADSFAHDKMEPAAYQVPNRPSLKETSAANTSVRQSAALSESNSPASKENTHLEGKRNAADNGDSESAQTAAPKEPVARPYEFPPISLLKKIEKKDGGNSLKELKETAAKLQQTLHTFGVNVTITDISQGPAVTRYELQPEQGVKVSKILGLSDDIKLNLAATDIRIEAPIPGKAAIGIEIPNKENSAVGLRELIESKEFRDFPSNLAFAVGKDIGGKVVVADIAKMPHMLIAGATGSGKSVCINTLIMSLIYKSKPEDVKLILVDPKVVELSVYNGIPHLLIPVVTDPKKASAALQWGVAEMMDRYQKFADFNVRDLKGFNKKAEEMRQNGKPDAPSKLPQIVIIVDELADLMMVAPGEVEEAICRLAQLARAAGIHLIIATQRPSVDVITGLIKANMPSRVAFSVSSGVDSRTILDTNGAEKLLGKGDMLFYPQGYTKPARVQGAFVSDGEVSDVVDFLKNQVIGNVYSPDIEEKLKNMGSGGTAGGNSQGGTEYDAYFADAGRFIIDKDKASIGMLQRVFKVGFNRAARIMDQLAEAGVVGDEEGTKPRKVLMSLEEFEQFVEETL